MIKEMEIEQKLDIMYPNPICELDYILDYELLIATVLSAQSTDKRVNMVTKVLFGQYDIFDLAKMNPKDIEPIIKSAGTYQRKAEFVVEIAKSLVQNHGGSVPNDREYLESLPGVGRKTANLVLSNIFNIPTIAVDTHVTRVSVILGLADEGDNISIIEQKIMQKFPKEKWNRINDQLVLFGRYTCKSKKPECITCAFNKNCEYKKS